MMLSPTWKIVVMAVAIVIVSILAFGVYGVTAVGGMTHHEGKPFTPRSSR